jgi:peptide-methionine (S)-S-oxide reductase
MHGIWAIAMALVLAMAPLAGRAAEPREAIFAGGCFWCVESDFDRVPGVLETTSGYTGGHSVDPTYRQVGTKTTGHREAVRIVFDPAQVSYAQLLHAFWRTIDPTDGGGQFCDRGEPYHSAVFVIGAEQRRLAEDSKAATAAALGRTIATTIEDAGTFYPAEDYHQDYHRKSANTYKLYRWRCGRNERVRKIWGERAYEGIPMQ